MAENNLLVITVEGVGTTYLGSYGSTTAVTPALDRWSAHGIVLDQCYVDSLDVTLQMRSLWTGLHAMQSQATTWNLWRETSRRGNRLITDSRTVAELAAQLECGSVSLVTAGERRSAVDDISDCAVLELFAAATEELAGFDGGMLWIHSRGLKLPWDAPQPLRQRFMDPEDPQPPVATEPPECSVDQSTDPDILLGWGQVAAAQVAVIDEAIGALQAALHSRNDATSWACLFATLGGVPLGEHGYMGNLRPQLYGESIAAAAILVPTGGLPVGIRRPELYQLPDLALSARALLHGDFSNGSKVEQACWGRSACTLNAPEVPQRWATHLKSAMISDRQQWVRTPAWSALLDPHKEAELYLKPDDRWEVSDIASRREDIVAQHRMVAAAFCEAVARNSRESLPELDETMCSLLR